jgi:hypothetical protein
MSTQRHVLAALTLTEEWYTICRETLELLLGYGAKGQYVIDPRVVEAESSQAPADGRLGVERWTNLLVLLKGVHEEFSASQRSRFAVS